MNENKSLWPKKTVLYLHGCKDSNYDMAGSLGLNEEATRNFAYTCYEVRLNVEVLENGDVYATHFQGVALSQKVKV